MQQPKSPNGPDMKAGDKFTLHRRGNPQGPQVLIGEVVTAKPWNGDTEYGYKMVEIIEGPGFTSYGNEGVGSVYYFSASARPEYTWEILHDLAPIATEIEDAIAGLAELANVPLLGLDHANLTDEILRVFRMAAKDHGLNWTDRGAVEPDVNITVPMPPSVIEPTRKMVELALRANPNATGLVAFQQALDAELKGH